MDRGAKSLAAGAALAGEDGAQIGLRGNDGPFFHFAFAHGLVQRRFAQELCADLGHRGQAVGAHHPVGQPALGQQRVFERSRAARQAGVARHIKAAQHPTIGAADGEGAVHAAQQLVPLHALLPVPGQGEARHRQFDHHVVIVESPAPASARHGLLRCWPALACSAASVSECACAPGPAALPRRDAAKRPAPAKRVPALQAARGWSSRS